MSRTVAIDLCPKSGLNLAKRWLSKTNIQDTKVIVGLKLLTTGTKVTTVVCAQGKKIIWFKISSNKDRRSNTYIQAPYKKKPEHCDINIVLLQIYPENFNRTRRS